MKFSKLVAGCLAVCLVGSAVPFVGVKDVPAITAKAETIVDSGTIKDTNISWTLTDTGVLTVSGTGEVPRWVGSSFAKPEIDDVKSIVVGEGITSIGDSAFSQLDSVTSVSLPSTLTAIGDDAFGKCSKLEKIIIPEGVTTIGVRAFQFCSALKEIIVPASVDSIGGHAFEHCNVLESVTILNPDCTFGSSVFDSKETLTIHGYAGSTAEEKYGKKSITNKVNFDTNVQIPDSQPATEPPTTEPPTEPPTTEPLTEPPTTEPPTEPPTTEPTTEPKKTVRGDWDGDGEISVVDMVKLYRDLTSSPPKAPDRIFDVNGDDKVNIIDLVLIMKYLMGTWKPEL